MFKFLKDKLKDAVSSISKEVEEGGEEVEVKEIKTVEEKKGFFSRFKKKEVEEIQEEEDKEEETKKEIVEESKEELEEEFSKEVEEAEREKSPIEIIKKQYEEVEDKKEEEPKKEKVEEKPTIQQTETHITAQEILDEVEEPEKEKVEPVEEKKGFFSKLKEKATHTKISEDKFEDIFWELEMGLLESNVAVEVIDKIKLDLKEELVNKSVSRSKVEESIKNTLKNSVEDLFEESIDLPSLIKQKEGPFVIAFIGINGVGKTTSLAKVAKKLQNENFKSVIAAGDTFRVAAIEQLEQHANNLEIKMIKHDYGADSAAVCYDAIEHAKSKKLDVVLIDTAGRMNADVNLMQELKKIIKVASPDLTIFVGDSLTGNDMIEQAKTFNETVGIDAIILSKTDADEKGGGSISVSYITHKPIIYIGTGQSYDDLEIFSSEIILKSLGLV